MDIMISPCSFMNTISLKAKEKKARVACVAPVPGHSGEALNYRVGAREMAQWAKCLLCMFEDLSSDPQCLCKIFRPGRVWP